MPIKFIRKPNRLPNKILYSGSNWYFVTICVQDRVCVFDTVEAGFIRHNFYLHYTKKSTRKGKNPQVE